MISRIRACALAAVLLLAGCIDFVDPWPDDRRHPGFTNRVWSVSRSTSVEPGTLYVFLEEGTLIVASPHGKPSLGTWKKEKKGELTMVEEGIPYRTEILALTPEEMTLRSHNPGEPVDITLVPADR